MELSSTRRGLAALVCAYGVLLLCAPVSAQVELPTPLEHYEADSETVTRKLALELLAALPEDARALALGLLSGDAGGEIGADPLAAFIGRGDASDVTSSPEWKRLRPLLAKLLLHGSGALDAVPEGAREFYPLIHDALLFFLDHLQDERLLARLVAQAKLPRDATRGERVLAFVEETPSLQKLGQILARNPAIDENVRSSLQKIENSLESMTYEEIREQLDEEFDRATVERYRLRFADDIMAEASVGAVIRATYRVDESGEDAKAACKVLKPRAVDALKADLAIIDSALIYLEEHGSYYGIGAAPLADMFEEIREALSREVQVEEEQENLRVAATYFSNDPRVKVPGVLPFSTRNVTCMEFIDGVKVTDAFPGRANDRARLARRLSDLLTFDVLFAKVPMALFHGDPHAGNVFHVGTNGGPLSGRDADALRIALLDWGLAAELTLEDRERVTQLMLGLRLGHAKRIANNISAFVDLKGEPGESESLLVLAEGFLAERERNGLFEGLDELLTILAREGYAVHYRAAMFIKAQLTIAGIMKELDPSFDQSEYLMDRMQGQVMRELPKRLLRTVWFPAWNSHDYRSLMSNEDVKDVQVQQVVGAFAAVGKGLWRAVSLRWLF